LGSYHGLHTFFKVSSPVVMGRSDSGRVCHSSEEDAWLACGALVRVAASSPARAGACGHVPLQNFEPFSPMASSLSPLHSGMVKT
jgi:hypothetical protein